MPAAARTRQKGRTKYVPSEEHRKTVATMIGVGMDQNSVCAVLEITVPTLHRHYRRELDASYAKLLTRMRAKLVAKADAGDVACLIFFNQTHGWNDRLVVVDGGYEDIEPRKMSDAELDARLDRLTRPGGKIARLIRPG